MRAYTHRDVAGHTDSESAQHYDSEKLPQMFIVLRTGFEPLLMTSIGSGGRRCTNGATTWVDLFPECWSGSLVDWFTGWLLSLQTLSNAKQINKVVKAL